MPDARSPRGLIARGLVPLILGAALVLAPMGPALAQVEGATFEGGGWGHGVGMSQYGARGQAIDGRTYAQILEHYYEGASVVQLSQAVPSTSMSPLLEYDEPIWVGLVESVTSTQFQVLAGALQLCRGEVCSELLRAEVGESWMVERIESGDCQFRRNGVIVAESVGTCHVDGYFEGEHARVRMLVSNKVIGHGTMRIRPKPSISTQLHVAFSMDFEDYVAGINEVPSWWEEEALKAQAVAARSFAASKVHEREIVGSRPAPDEPQFTASGNRAFLCMCHVRSTTADQVYMGYPRTTDPRWSGATSSTAGEVVTHPNSSFTRRGVAETFYYSSSGGVTEDNRDGFGSTANYPYLVSVPDPWSVSAGAGNPNASWTKQVPESLILSKLAEATTPAAWRYQFDWILDVEVVNGPPGAQVRFTGVKNGVTHSVIAPGRWVRGAFGLLSAQVSGVSWVGSARAPGDELLFYRTDGAFKYVETMPDGSPGSTINQGTNYQQGWSVVTAVDLDGDGQDEILFYRADGTYEYRRVDGNGILGAVIKSGSDYTKNWTSITAVDLNGDGIDELLFYRADGLFRFYRTQPNGSIGSPLAAGSNFTKDWTSIVALDLDGDGRDELFFYRSDGLYRFYKPRLDGALPGPFQSGSNYTSGWTSITGVDLNGDGRDEMFFYRDDGLYRFYKPRPDGSLPAPLAAGNDYETGWSTITAVNIDGR